MKYFNISRGTRIYITFVKMVFCNILRSLQFIQKLHSNQSYIIYCLTIMMTRIDFLDKEFNVEKAVKIQSFSDMLESNDVQDILRFFFLLW